MRRDLWRTLLLSSVVLFAALTVWSFEGRVMGSPETTLSVEPRVNVKAPGELFNVTVTVADIANDNRLYAWEFNVTFNPVVLEATKYLLGPFPPEGATWDLEATFNNTSGWVAGGDALRSYSDPGLNGTGILAYLTFRVKAEGKSNLHFSYTALRGWNPSTMELTQIAHTSIDALFQYPLLRDLAITGITSSLTSVSSGGSVSVDVTVTNYGNVSETFDVTLSYNSTLIDTKTVTDLAPDAVDTVNFVWDTKNVAPGNYVMTATAVAVSGEANTADNSNSTLVVKVTAAPPIIPIELLIIVIVVVAAAGVGAFFFMRRRSSKK